MNVLMIPILLPLITAALCLIAMKHLRAQQILAGLAGHAMMVVSVLLVARTAQEGPLAIAVGGWPGSYGIVLVVDLLGAIMIALSSLIYLATYWFVVLGGTRRSQQARFFHPLLLILVCGVNWAFSTGDLFNLFVSFELMLLASYVLITHTNNPSQIRESVQFITINVLTGLFFLAAAGLMYGTTGTLNFADLALKVRETDQPGLITALGTLLLIIFGIKAALFPMFFWLPDAYPRAPIGVLPYFSGMLTKVGVYALFRIMTLIFQIDVAEWFQPLLLAIAAGTMLIGVLGAISQWSMRRILSFHIISQIGYMIFGLGLMTPLGLAAGIFYIMHHIIVKSSLFLVAGVVTLGECSDQLKRVHGVMTRRPFLAALFMLAAFSLAGLPPLSGFYGKYLLVVEGVREQQITVTVISLVTSLLTLASMVKIWQYIFWGEHKKTEPRRLRVRGLSAVTAGLVCVSVLVAIGSGGLMRLAERAANQLLDTDAYIQAVHGADYTPAADAPASTISAPLGEEAH